MNNTTVNAYNFSCPFCGDDFTEEDLIDLMGEPFNGTVVECAHCHHEFNAEILITLEDITGNEGDDGDFDLPPTF